MTPTLAMENRELYSRRLRDTLPRLWERIAQAAARRGRRPEDVTLVAITKGHPLGAVHAAVEAGITDLGENRVTDLAERVAAVRRPGIRWHMVGHLQRRQVGRAMEAADLLHSLDSHRLAERISRLARKRGREVPVLVQVNTSGELSKGGFELESAIPALERVLALPSLRVEGLMTMAPFTGEEEIVRATFRRLRELHERAAEITAYRGRELSMGMTNDFSIAVEEGSTMVRIGTALFGRRGEERSP